MTNDTELENIEVDEPVIQRMQSEGSRFKQEICEETTDPLCTEDYLETTPRRKSPTKRQSTTQASNGKPFDSKI